VWDDNVWQKFHGIVQERDNNKLGRGTIRKPEPTGCSLKQYGSELLSHNATVPYEPVITVWAAKRFRQRRAVLFILSMLAYIRVDVAVLQVFVLDNVAALSLHRLHSSCRTTARVLLRAHFW